MKRFLHLMGWRANATSHLEKWLSAIGALCGIAAIYAVTHWVLPSEAAIWVVASMGASAVLLFAVPHGALSQPWAVLGGQVLSAIVGVLCQALFPDQPFTPALAVAAAILVMHYARCIHPPGGATALAAVSGGPAITALGLHYVLSPVLLNVALTLVVAVLFNGLFAWRRYPAPLARLPATPTLPAGPAPEDLYHALRKMDSYIDVQFDDLLKILQLAQEHAQAQRLTPEDILLGARYSNALIGDAWAVRQVIDDHPDKRGRQDQVVYKVVAGAGKGNTGVCRRQDLLDWAAHPVIPQGDGWVRSSAQDSAQDALQRQLKGETPRA